MAPTPGLLAQLDDCIACGSCERACPANVGYGELLDLTRDLPAVRAAEPRARAVLRQLARRPRLLRLLLRLARGLGHVGLSRAAGILDARAQRAVALAQAIPAAALTAAPESAPASAADVVVLAGCIGAASEGDTIAALAAQLRALGHRPLLLTDGSCCGALARHAGDAAGAQAIEAATRARLSPLRALPWLSLASGCQAAFAERIAAPLGARVVDALAFIAEQHEGILQLAPGAPRRVAWMAPCIQRALGDVLSTQALLSRIDGLDWIALPEQPTCCGAGGAYFLDHPRIADALAAERVAQIVASRVDAVVSANIGCRLHLRAALVAAGHPLPVLHPLALLAPREQGTADVI